MAAFRRASHEPVNVFAVDGRYLFKQFFEEDEVFGQLSHYYNGQKYRFEVPPDEFEAVRTFLADHGYGLVVADVVEEFTVVVRKYTDHPNNIFKNSVAKQSIDDYNCFLMTDQSAVEQAVQEGATRLTETDLANPF